MDAAQVSRKFERYVFWALIGTLSAVVVIRGLLLAVDVSLWWLLALLLIGAWSGAFLSYASGRQGDVVFETLRSRTPELRAISLKAMLWLLGAAAVIGVLTVLTASYDVLGRVGGTVLATAIAAGLLWPLSLMIDAERSLPAGLLGMAIVVVVYCLVLPLIWEMDRHDEEILLTSLVIGLSAPAGMVTTLMTGFPKSRFSGRLGTVIYAMVLVCFGVATWHPGSWHQQEFWWEFGWWMTAYGSLATLCLAGWVASRVPNWRWLGVFASLAAWGLVVFNLWSVFAPSNEKPIVFLTTVAVVFAHTSLTQLIPLFASQTWVRWATTISAVTTGLFLNLELLLAPGGGLGMLGRISGAAGVLASSGTLALMVLAGLNGKGAAVPQGEQITEITLFCPACGKKQTVPLGGGTCKRCHLTVTVGIER